MTKERHAAAVRRGLSAAIAALLVVAWTAACQTQSPRLRPPPEALTSVATPLPAAMSELRGTFRARYDAAVAAHGQYLRSSYPVITQDLLNMTLWRPDGSPLRYSMQSGPYLLMAHISHIPLTVYSILSVQGFGALSDTTREQLLAYREVLGKAATQLQALELPHDTELRLRTILERTAALISASLTRGTLGRDDFEAYVAPLRGLIRENLRTGANEQLRQFRGQLAAWRAQFPQEKWAELRVVVLGIHQMRDQYALKLLFQWLLREPGYERRVVYAELSSPPSGDARKLAETQALNLLAKVDFEQDAALAVFGDATVLQKDVMGPAALEIIGSFGPSDWPDGARPQRR